MNRRLDSYMTLALWCSAFAVLIPYLLAGYGGYYRKKYFGVMDNLNPRIQTAQLEGSGARLASHCLLDESIQSAISYKHQWIILLRYLDFPGGEVTQVSA